MTALVSYILTLDCDFSVSITFLSPSFLFIPIGDGVIIDLNISFKKI